MTEAELFDGTILGLPEGTDPAVSHVVGLAKRR